VVPSNATARALLEAGLDRCELESSVVVIPHGSDHLPRGDSQGCRELLAKVGLDHPFLLAVGTLEPRKNLPRLIAAYRMARQEAKEEFPDLAIVGPRGWGDSPGRILEDQGAAKDSRQRGVFWLGEVPPRVMAGLYEAAVGLVYVPLLEGFGLPVFEAMAKGLPMVASPVPALEEAATMVGSGASERGKLARVVDPGDTEDIAEGIVQLVFDDALRRELVDSSRAVASKATWARSARLHKELWEQLTSSLGGRSKELGNDTGWRASLGKIKVTLDVTAVPVESVGVGRYLEGLTGGLCKLGSLELVLIARRGDRDRWVRWAPCAQVLDIAPRGRLTRLFWQHLWEGRVLSRIRPDVHHGPHYFAPRVPGLPSVVTIHDMTFIEHPEWHEGPKAHLFAWEIKKTVRHADVILCVSNFSAGRLRALSPPGGELRVVHHGVNAELFSPDEPSEGFDAKVLLELKIQQPYLLFVGTIEPRKGVPVLIEAFCKLLGSQDCPQGLKLVLVGSEGWGIAEVRSTIERLGCQKDVIMTGWVEDQTVAALLRRAKAVAYPSWEEGFGLPALEALACGATLVTTRGSAVEEVVGEMAYLVDPGDVSGLAEALGEALGIGAVGESAAGIGVATRLATRLPTREERVHYARRFTWEACAAEHLDAYHTAVALATKARVGKL
jgi:glycosyltransferase involved in cell wall biosynthesis